MRRASAATFGILFLWAAVALGAYNAWDRGADHRDFYPRWAGVRRLLEGKRDLYSDSATQAIQLTLYGTILPPDVDQGGFAYPAHLAVLFLPFGLIPDVEVATAIWQGLSLVLMLVSLLLLRDHQGERCPALVVTALLVWHYPLLMLFQGQVTALPVASLSIATVGYVLKRDFLSGSVLSLAAVKPEMAILPTAVLIIVSLTQRRLRFLLGYLLANLVLFCASLLMAGWWPLDWFAALSKYAHYAKIVWPLAEAWRIHPGLAVVMVMGTTASLWLARRNTLHLVCLAILAGLLLLPQTLTWGLAILAVPLMVLWHTRARIACVALWLLGWLALYFRPLPHWWKVQAAVMPVLLIVAFTLAISLAGDVHDGQTRPAKQ